MWQTISYVSTAIPDLNDSGIKNLFNYVNNTNNRNNINGILMYSDGNFFQIMEGENTLIKNIYENILLDPRHYNIIKIFDHELPEPRFTYQATFTTISEKSDNKKLQFFLEKEKLNNPDTFNTIACIANKFIQLA